MSIVVIGVNHRTGPLSVLERVTIPPEDVPKAVAGLSRRDNIREVAVLSTCNRTEVYAVAERFHGAYADICSYLCELGNLDPNDLNPYLYSQHDDAAVSHLFAVAAGLESAVLGESEILGQVREAWKLAQAEGGARATLNQLFRQALRVGKRARTETGIARGTASVSHAAVEMLTDRIGSLSDQRLLVVGAGAMGEGVAVALAAHGASSITVVNRNESRAIALATRVGGRSLDFGALGEAVADADVIVSCTGSGAPLITTDLVSTLRLDERPLHIIDIAVPRDVDPAVGGLPGVDVLDLDDLRDWADRGLACTRRRSRARPFDRRRRGRGDSTSIVSRGRPRHWSRRCASVPIGCVRQSSSGMRLGSPASTRPQREVVEALTKSLVAKLLHEPSVRLKHDAGTPRGERNAAAVRDLFDLG